MALMSPGDLRDDANTRGQDEFHYKSGTGPFAPSHKSDGIPQTPPKRAAASRGRRVAAFSVILILVLGGFAGFVYWKIIRTNAAIAAHSFESPPIEVAVVTVTPTRIPVRLDGIGTLQAIRVVDVAPEVSGRVVAIDFEAGQTVRQGDRLLQLDDRLERAELKSAAAKLGFTQLQLERSKTLVVSQAESLQALDQRQLEHDQAQATIEQLETQIAQKLIAAPFDGVLGLRDVNLGQYIGAGTKAVTLTALDELHVNFAIPQQELARLKISSNVIVRSDSAPDEEFPATISAIDPVIDTDTRNVMVQATMRNPRNRLRPGLFVTVSVVLPDRDNVILVPATAVQASASGDTVFVVKEGNAEIIPINTGERIGDNVIVEAGLSAGDTVITRGQLRVYPGASVTPKYQQAKLNQPDQNATAQGKEAGASAGETGKEGE